MIVYQITNKLNGMSYTGCTKRSLLDRYGNRLHPNPKMVSNKALREDIIKFGKEHFFFKTLLETSCEKEMENFEKKQIEKTTWPNGYNFQSGGRRGTKIHPETKKKILKNIQNNGPWNKGLKYAPTETRVCAHCNKEFDSYVVKGSERKCCSRDCFRLRMSSVMKKRKAGV